MFRRPSIADESKPGQGPCVWTVEVPLPPLASSANFRGHSHSRSKTKGTARYRKSCALLFMQARIPLLVKKRETWKEQQAPTTPVVMDLDFFYGRVKGPDGKTIPDRLCRCRDDDGAVHSMKAARDALQDAGIIPADTSAYLKIGTVRLRTRQDEHEGAMKVVITLTAPEQETPQQCQPTPAS